VLFFFAFDLGSHALARARVQLVGIGDFALGLASGEIVAV